jgi:acyl-CoA synthetase (AMP-forming)/AMP-acid ligase II
MPVRWHSTAGRRFSARIWVYRRREEDADGLRADEDQLPDRADWSLSRVLALQAERHGGKPFVTEPGRVSYTYRETDGIASRIAGGLRDRGLEAGDRLMIYLDNCSEYILAWFGASRANVVEVPTNTDYFGDFLRHCLTVTSPRAIVVGTRYVPRFAELGEFLRETSPAFFVVGDDAQASLETLRALGCRAEPSTHCGLGAGGACRPPAATRLGAMSSPPGTPGRRRA